MSDLDYQSERDPIFWWRGFPVRAAAFLVILHTACLLAWTFVFAAQKQVWMQFVAFDTSDFLGNYRFLLTPLTYGFVHQPMGALGFAWEMFLLWMFGSQVEHFFGKRLFLRLYGLLWLLTPLVLLVFSWMGPQVAIGAGTVHLCIFVAFAAIYPSARIYFGIQAIWIAVILVAAYSIMDIANRDVVQLILLWVSVATTWCFVAWRRGEFTFRLPAFLRAKPKFRVLPKPQPIRRMASQTVRDTAMDDVDELLDKIARTGLNSLTSGERERLERASADLKKDR